MRRIWALNAGLVAVAAALHFLVMPGMEALPAEWLLPWWVLAGLFAVCELATVHVHFRNDAHSFTLSDIALVVGLFFGAPIHLVLGRLVGSGLVLGLHRRQRPVKLVFNLAMFWLEAGLVVVVFRGLSRLMPFDGLPWPAVFPAVLLTSLLSMLLIFVAISLASGATRGERMWTALGYTLITTATNVSLGIVLVALLDASPSMAWILVVPAATVYACYRGYSTTKRKHEGLEFLYEAGRLLQGTRDIDDALVSLLEHMRSNFRADVAELALWPAPGDGRLLRTTLGPGVARTVMEPEDFATAADQSAPQSGRAAVVRRSYATPGGGGAELRDVMVIRLLGEARVLGTLTLENRPGDVSTFDDQDLRLFETLAGQVAVSLENGHLERKLAHVTQLKEEYERQALHDPLTGLANRALFMDRVEHAAARSSRQGGALALLFVDLDDFKEINDTMGHVAGDRLLVLVAERLRGCLRPTDTAARLGGDEFAVLLEDVTRAEEASAVAGRIGESLLEAFHLDGRRAEVRASVGVAFSSDGRESAQRLLDAADLAMYRAKQQGKGRYEVFEPSMRVAAGERSA